jgi:hypothetical protein
MAEVFFNTQDEKITFRVASLLHSCFLCYSYAFVEIYSRQEQVKWQKTALMGLYT